MSKSYCLFCDLHNVKNKIIIENDLFYARWDNFPVSKGHAEIVPKKHIKSFFDFKDSEIIELMKLAKKVKNIIDKKFKPDSYNIGVNDWPAAGRTIEHTHLHIIPRHKGDVKDPRGGIRNIIPGKGKY